MKATSYHKPITNEALVELLDSNEILRAEITLHHIYSPRQISYGHWRLKIQLSINGNVKDYSAVTTDSEYVDASRADDTYLENQVKMLNYVLQHSSELINEDIFFSEE